MKKFMKLSLIALFVFAFSGLGMALAMVIPPQGEGQIGISAVVMLNDLPIYESADETSKVTQTLESGRHVIVMEQVDGWARLALSDSVDDVPAGWVRAESLFIDNAWYMTDSKTPLYAWNDNSAPVLDVLDEMTLIPVLKIDGEWLVVSLRGASAWILNPEADAE